MEQHTATPGIGAHGQACADTCSSISGSSRRRQTMTSTSISRWMTRGTSSRSNMASPIGPHWWRSPSRWILGTVPKQAIQLGTVPISTVPIRATGGEAGSPGRSVGARDLTDDPAHAGLGRDPRPSRFTARRASLRRRADDGRHPRQRRAIETITDLDLSGSQAVTDDGLRHLVRLPRLRRLDLTGTAITDRGLAVLRELPALESIAVAMTHVTDDGAAVLADCGKLARVDFAGTHTGDGVIRALAGKREVSQLSTGNRVTDEDFGCCRAAGVQARGRAAPASR